MKKTLLLASLALVAFASPSLAYEAGPRGHGPNAYGKMKYSPGFVTKRERFAIKKQKNKIRHLKMKARRDGVVTKWERQRIKQAQRVLVRLVKKSKRF